MSDHTFDMVLNCELHRQKHEIAVSITGSVDRDCRAHDLIFDQDWAQELFNADDFYEDFMQDYFATCQDRAYDKHKDRVIRGLV
jgi:hypothetical protein